jgi:Rrf2 family protein
MNRVVNLKISTKGRYALRLMVDLAQCKQGKNVALKEVAARQGISLKYLEQIITVLTKAGYVLSARGSNGGYRLAHEPEYYTVGMILRLTEGSLAPVACLEEVSSLNAHCFGHCEDCLVALCSSYRCKTDACVT